MKHFYLPPGYRVELVASEPLVQDPIAVDWDADGRLWVVEYPEYVRSLTDPEPNLEPIGRITVLEDTDNDGKMDKRTVFADGLAFHRIKRVITATLEGWDVGVARHVVARRMGGGSGRLRPDIPEHQRGGTAGGSRADAVLRAKPDADPHPRQPVETVFRERGPPTNVPACPSTSRAVRTETSGGGA